MILDLPVTTRRLKLRRMVLADAEDRFALHSDQQYIDYIGQEITRESSDLELQSEIASGNSSKRMVAAICHHASDRLIGEVALIRQLDGVVELVVAIALDHRGNGYSSEIARELIVRALADESIAGVMARIAEANEQSIALVHALGMAETDRGTDWQGRAWREFRTTRSDA